MKCQPGWRTPTPGSVQTSVPAALTVAPPATSQSPVSWLNDTRLLLAPGASPSVLGRQIGAGWSKFVPRSDWTVTTRLGSMPGGNGPGSRSGGTTARPTLPPRDPSSEYRASAGTVTSAPA